MAAKLPLSAPGPAAVLYVIISLCWLLLSIGCSDPESELNEQLRTEIIRVHDLAMEQTGHIFDLQVQLSRIDGDLQAEHNTIARLIAALKEADRAMFSWMNQYQILSINDDISADNAYRKEQLEAILSVSRITDKVVADAEQFIAATDTVSQ